MCGREERGEEVKAQTIFTVSRLVLGLPGPCRLLPSTAFQGELKRKNRICRGWKQCTLRCWVALCWNLTFFSRCINSWGNGKEQSTHVLRLSTCTEWSPTNQRDWLTGLFWTHACVHSLSLNKSVSFFSLCFLCLCFHFLRLDWIVCLNTTAPRSTTCQSACAVRCQNGAVWKCTACQQIAFDIKY